MWNIDSIDIATSRRDLMLMGAGENFTALYFSEGVHKLFTAVGALASAVGARLFFSGCGLKKKARSPPTFFCANVTIFVDALKSSK
jgi:hypothetical protein